MNQIWSISQFIIRRYCHKSHKQLCLCYVFGSLLQHCSLSKVMQLGVVACIIAM
uniref:Uncharacterized protein n=1 Tax=Anguilla anguilla TaxID=7936 RepID=A0A0E9QI78_ANGAN